METEWRCRRCGEIQAGLDFFRRDLLSIVTPLNAFEMLPVEHVISQATAHTRSLCEYLSQVSLSAESSAAVDYLHMHMIGRLHIRDRGMFLDSPGLSSCATTRSYPRQLFHSQVLPRGFRIDI